MVRQLLGRLRLPLQIGFVLLLSAVVVRTAAQHWEELRSVQSDLNPPWVTAGAILTMVFTFGLSLSWQWLVRRLSPAGADLSSLGLHQAFLTSFLTRYLPAGTFVNIGGKVELLKRQGTSRSVGLESVLYELVFLMGGGLFLGWVAFLVEPAPQLLGEWQALYSLLMIGVPVAWVMCFSVPDRVLLWARAILKRQVPAITSARLSWLSRFVAFILYTAVNMIQGVAMLCMLLAVYPSMPLDTGVMLHVIAAYPLGRLVGQMVPFAPGGLGVRELTFAFLVAPWLPLRPVLIAATLMRLISILVEVLAASVVLGLGRRRDARLQQGNSGS